MGVVLSGLLSMQVIGNGDVFSFEDYEAHMKSGNVRSNCMLYCSIQCLCGMPE